MLPECGVLSKRPLPSGSGSPPLGLLSEDWNSSEFPRWMHCHLNHLKQLLNSGEGPGICPGRGRLSQGCRAKLRGQFMGLASREGGLCGDVDLLWESGQEPGRGWPQRNLQVGLGRGH